MNSKINGVKQEAKMVNNASNYEHEKIEQRERSTEE
jgi:hypothetical protein